MNIRNIALFAVAAAFAAGCTPKNPPSNVEGIDTNKSDVVTTKPDTGISQLPPDGPIVRDPSTSEKIAKWTGRPEDLNPAAIVYVVHFGFDKYNVEASERAKIDGAVASLHGKPAVCAGYTDHFGTAEYNLGLSDKRANSVKSYIESAGVGNTDIRAFGSQFAKPSGSKEEVADDRKVIIIDPSKM